MQFSFKSLQIILYFLKGPGKTTGEWHARFARAVGVCSETLGHTSHLVVYLFIILYLPQ